MLLNVLTENQKFLNFQQYDFYFIFLRKKLYVITIFLKNIFRRGADTKLMRIKCVDYDSGKAEENKL